MVLSSARFMLSAVICRAVLLVELSEMQYAMLRRDHAPPTASSNPDRMPRMCTYNMWYKFTLLNSARGARQEETSQNVEKRR